MSALHAVVQVELHVVAQIVEAELVVGSVGDIGRVGFAALPVVKVVHDDANRQPEERVQLAHPLGVALGQVVVDRDHVHAVPGKCVEIHRKGGDQRLAFAGLHLGDLALVQNHAADKLHVEMPHLEHAPTALARYCESFRQNFVEHFFQRSRFFVGVFDRVHALVNALAKFVGLGPELLVRELLHLGLERVDALHQRHQALDFALIAGAKNLGH